VKIYTNAYYIDRSALVHGWNGDKDEKGNLVNAEADKAQIIVSTIGVLGVGYTLTRACHLMLTEPAYLIRDEYQAYSRVRRISQRAKRTYTYRFVNIDNDIEQGIIKRQKGRIRFTNLSFRQTGDPPEFGTAAYPESAPEAPREGSPPAQLTNFSKEDEADYYLECDDDEGDKLDNWVDSLSDA